MLGVDRPTGGAVRYQVPVTATADANGLASFTFPDAPEGQWQVGTITVAAAPANASFAATVALQPWGVWNGSAPSPVIQVDPRSHATVAATFLTPGAAYVAWFVGWSDVVDALIYPTESTTPTQQSVTLLGAAESMPIGTAIVPISASVTPWLQTLAIRVLHTAGTANGLLVQVTDPTAPLGGDVIGRAPLSFGQWLYVPVGGRPCSIEFDALLNGAGSGLANSIFVEVAGIAQTFPYTTLGEIPLGAGIGLGQSVQANIGAGATTAMIANNPTGTVVRVRSVNVQYATAPAAVAGVLLVGSVSGRPYWRRQTPAAVNELVDPTTWLVAESSLPDPTEGLSLTNGATVSATVSIRYDVIPFALATAAP